MMLPALDQRIRAVRGRLESRLTLGRLKPDRATRAGIAATAGLLLVTAGIATFTTGAALIFAGLVLVVCGVGYARGVG